jgi:hypothetical protein
MPKPKPNPKKRTNPFESKKPLKLNNYTIDIAETNYKTLNIYSLLSKKNQSHTSLPKTITEIKKIAKENGYKSITGTTWIFAEHPKIAERMGIIIPQERIIAFNKLKEKYKILKIIGINNNKKIFRILPPEISEQIRRNPAFVFSVIDCIVETNKGPERKTVIVPFNSVFIPFTIKL